MEGRKVGDFEPEEIEPLLTSRGWKPLGKTTDYLVGTSQLVERSNIDIAQRRQVRLQLVEAVRRLSKAFDVKVRAGFRRRLREDIFIYYVFTHNQQKDAVKYFRQTGRTKLKLDKNFGIVRILHTLVAHAQTASPHLKTKEALQEHALTELVKLQTILLIVRDTDPENVKKMLKGNPDSRLSTSAGDISIYEPRMIGRGRGKGAVRKFLYPMAT